MEKREKKFWREIIRVEEKDNHTVMVVIPAWRSNEKVDFKIGEFSKEQWEALVVGGRYFAMVNSDATCMADLEIRDLEIQNLSSIALMSDDQISKNASSIPATDLIEEILRLRRSIRSHQAKTGHHLCWLNDQELWRSVDPSAIYPHDKVPGKEEFLANCEKYHKSRVEGLPYVEAEQKTCAVTKDGKVIDGKQSS